MAAYATRVVDDLLAARMRATGAVLVEGPKACGKTETATRMAASVVRLDVDEDARRAAAVDPSLLLAGPRPRLIDEWQLFPRVWDHVRRAVDDAGEPGQFLLTGSATPCDDARRHSGAGRFATLRMRPMTLHELGASSDEVSLRALFDGVAPSASGGTSDLRDTLALMVTGGWPQQLQRSDPGFARDYLEQVVHVDVNTVVETSGTRRRRRDPGKVLACLRSLARNVATPVGVRTIADDAGLSRDAVGDYLEALHRLLLVEEQPAFDVYLRSRQHLRSTPHLHLADPSLALAALETDVDGLVADLRYAGLLFESLVVRDLAVLGQPLGARVSYLHGDREEIDVVLRRPDGAWAGIEVKLGGEELVDRAAASLRSAVAAIDTERAGAPRFLAVVTAFGRYAYRRDDGVHVVPLSTLAP